MRIAAFILSMALALPAWAGEPPKQITVNGTALTYVEAGNGPPVVLVHGSLGDYRTWTGEMDTFATKYHVIAYSLRHHYPNNQWTDGQPYSVQVHLADLVALLQTLNLGSVHLVGHSYGGQIAVLLAKDHPDLLRTLVLAEASLGGMIAGNEEAKPQLAQVGATMKAAQSLVQNGQSEQAAVTFFDFVNEPSGGFKGMPEFYQNGIRQNASTIKPMLASPPPPSFTCEDAKNITMPALLIEGELTQKYRKMVNAELRRCLPNATVVTVPGAAHPLEMINPKGFNEAVLQFLTQH
jgi:pimeloyl-ACP methyl ester carboxylesterase